MTTKEEKAAKWPWRIFFGEYSGRWFVDREDGECLGSFGSRAAAIYAIAKTQE